MKPSPSSLPAVVLDRLDTETRSAVMQERFVSGDAVPVEVRTVRGVETRSNDDGTWEMRGYAIAYDYGYPIAGGPAAGGWTEIVQRGAADATVRRGDDVRLLFDHAGIPLARTASGTLELRSDSSGVKSIAPSLDPRSPYAQSVRSAVDRGDADQMSVAMRVTGQEWNDDYTVRTITEITLYDVSIVTYPANEATVVQMNSAKPETAELRRGDVLDLARAIEKRATDEAAEGATTEQVEALVAELIQGEAQEIIDGGEAVLALSALICILQDLAWFENVDAYEDGLTDDDAERSSALGLEYARALADA